MADDIVLYIGQRRLQNHSSCIRHAYRARPGSIPLVTSLHHSHQSYDWAFAQPHTSHRKARLSRVALAQASQPRRRECIPTREGVRAPNQRPGSMHDAGSLGHCIAPLEKLPTWIYQCEGPDAQQPILCTWAALCTRLLTAVQQSSITLCPWPQVHQTPRPQAHQTHGPLPCRTACAPPEPLMVRSLGPMPRESPHPQLRPP